MDIINNNEVPGDASVGLSTKKNKVEKISFIVLLVSIFLTPLIFIPSVYASLDTVKTVVISFGVLISGILYFISAWKSKELYFPKNPLVLTGIGIALSLIISTFLSSNFAKSAFGQGFETGTTSFILILFFGALITSYLAHRDKERVIYIYTAVIASFVIIAIYHLVRVFTGADFMSFGIFQGLSSTLLGKWSDFGVMAGLIGIISYLTLNFLHTNKLIKSLLGFLVILSGIVLVLVNNPLIWFVVALTVTGIIIYEYSIKSKISTADSKVGKVFNSVPWVSVIILIIALIFTWNGKLVNDKITTRTQLYPNEVVFPWQYTIDVASQTIKETPFFGAGPNRFSLQYLRFKPLEVNLSPFFEVEFSQGFALIPTFFVTQGIVGGFLWVLFTILFIILGAKELKKNNTDLNKFLIASTFFGTLFLFLMAYVYVSAHSILFLTFVFLGLFLATIDTKKYIPSQKQMILPIMIVIVVISAAWMFVYVKKTIAITFFQHGIAELNKPNGEGIENAENNFKKALVLDENDIYYQALSEIDLVKITKVTQAAQQAGNGNVDQPTIDQILKLVDEAMKYTDSAITLDPTNYYNYIAQSRVSETAMLLGVKEAYEKAKTSYANALNINRYSPSLYLNLARIEASNNNVAEAQSHIGTALQLKQNYIDAIFFLSQIQVAQGRIEDAITSTIVTTQLNPTNPLLFFQLGLLYYNGGNFEKASEALAQAIKLDNQYANAQYFLGLSYARLGKIALAVPYFETLSQSNPENEEIQFILGNLKAGKSPFAQAKPPIDTAPEKRKTLPVKETDKKAAGETTTSTKTSTGTSVKNTTP